jgi:RNA polymerase-binding transcription factor DksA
MNSETSLRRRANCSPYSPEELGRFRLLLAERRREALRSFDDLSESATRPPGDSAGVLSSLPQHLGDLASDTFEQSMSLGFLARTQDEIAEIDDALERIDLRAYGLCSECGQEIPAERLLAILTARLCAACKSLEES